MDSSQLEFISKRDPFINKYDPQVILDSELVSFKPLKIYFILLTKHEKKGRDKQRRDVKIIRGHWIMMETIRSSSRTSSRPSFNSGSILAYYDPLGQSCPNNLLKKGLQYCKKYDSKMYINRSIVQLPYSTICGAICIFVAMLITRPGNSYRNIKNIKLNHDLKFIVKTLPSFVSYFLPKGNKKIARFSLEFLM